MGLGLHLSVDYKTRSACLTFFAKEYIWVAFCRRTEAILNTTWKRQVKILFCYGICL